MQGQNSKKDPLVIAYVVSYSVGDASVTDYQGHTEVYLQGPKSAFKKIKENADKHGGKINTNDMFGIFGEQVTPVNFLDKKGKEIPALSAFLEDGKVIRSRYDSETKKSTIVEQFEAPVNSYKSALSGQKIGTMKIVKKLPQESQPRL